METLEDRLEDDVEDFDEEKDDALVEDSEVEDNVIEEGLVEDDPLDKGALEDRIVDEDLLEAIEEDDVTDNCVLKDGTDAEVARVDEALLEDEIEDEVVVEVVLEPVVEPSLDDENEALVEETKEVEEAESDAPLDEITLEDDVARVWPVDEELLVPSAVVDDRAVAKEP